MEDPCVPISWDGWMGFLPGKDLIPLFFLYGGREWGQILTFTCWILFDFIIAIITVNVLLGDIFTNNACIINVLE